MTPIPVKAASIASSKSQIRLAFITLTAILAAIPAFPNEGGARTVAASPAFLKYWKSGLAEISSYAIREERYGEMRAAQGVLVFVYEETNADTRIKVETDKTPVEKRIPVLKLNNVLKFSTGIYDYSVMTSVFAGLSGPGVTRLFQPQKISFSSQEWCGNVYQQLLPGATGITSEIHSYFEAEGDAKTKLAYRKGNIYYEDEMPILLRELDGEFLKPGSSMDMQMVPSLWERRKRHDELAFAPAVLTHSGSESFTLNGKQIPALKWVLRYREVTTTYHIEARFPHKLLAWENSHGEESRLVMSVRKPYWMLHSNKDLPLRTELGLKYGMDESVGAR